MNYGEKNLKKMITEKIIAYMVNLHPEDTGINTVIWVSHKCPHYKPFIIALTSTGKVLISIEDEPKVLQPNRLSDGDDISSVIQWICLNKDILLDYWSDDFYPTSQMLQRIKKLS